MNLRLSQETNGHYIIILTTQCTFFKVVKWHYLFKLREGRTHLLFRQAWH